MHYAFLLRVTRCRNGRYHFLSCPDHFHRYRCERCRFVYGHSVFPSEFSRVISPIYTHLGMNARLSHSCAHNSMLLPMNVVSTQQQTTEHNAEKAATAAAYTYHQQRQNAFFFLLSALSVI